MPDAKREITQMLQLAEILKKIAFVQQQASTEEASFTLSHAITDIVESCEKIVTLRLRLTADTPPAEVEDILGAIGEEIRHILYHVRDSRFYQYLLTPAP